VKGKAVEKGWCNKRYEDAAKLRLHSAGGLYAFHACGFMFPPMEMVGPESLPQVLMRCCSISAFWGIFSCGTFSGGPIVRKFDTNPEA